MLLKTVYAFGLRRQEARGLDLVDLMRAVLEGVPVAGRADATIKPRVEVVRRFARFSNQYPWQWTPGWSCSEAQSR